MNNTCDNTCDNNDNRKGTPNELVENENEPTESETSELTEPPSWSETLNEIEMNEITDIIYEMIDVSVSGDVENYSSPSFHETIIEETTSLLHIQLLESNQYDYLEEDYADLNKMVEQTAEIYFQEHVDVYPVRSFDKTFICEIPEKTEIEKLEIKINNLINTPQPKQRTPEWYDFRHNLITASNIWKALGTEKQQNSLIYEKCKPLVGGIGGGGAGVGAEDPELREIEMTTQQQNQQPQQVNTQSSLHKGVKYEPLSAMIYEEKYNTKIADFGCIKHQVHSFIGASPDGINVEKTSGRYGRMLEIKNIVNREINGVPKKEYWIQMQIQMETFDLDECDFFETQFKEYENETQFTAGFVPGSGPGSAPLPEYKGLILYFIEKNDETYTPHYEYMPLCIREKREMDEWVEQKVQSMSPKYILYEKNYWYLEKASCVLVKRNREWFKSILPKMEHVWKTIERERIHGYEHRAPTKRNAPTPNKLIVIKSPAIIEINKTI